MLKHFDRLGEVGARIGHGIEISRHLHPPCGSTHLDECVSEATRSDNEDCVDLLRRNKPCMGFSARKKHAFSGCRLQARCASTSKGWVADATTLATNPCLAARPAVPQPAAQE